MDATITATTIDGSKTASCTVTVTTRVTGVSTDKSTISLKVGDPDAKLNAVISPASATVKDVIWTSSNSNVATVASDGTVHAVAIGTATITVTTVDSAKTAKCVVIVPTPVSAVTISPAALTIMLGQTPVTIKTIITPSTASIKTVSGKAAMKLLRKLVQQEY